MIVAILALILAASGTAVAATKYVITSTAQIKPSVLKQLRGRDGARGDAGAQGALGAPGPQGTPGISTPASTPPVDHVFVSDEYINGQMAPTEAFDAKAYTRVAFSCGIYEEEEDEVNETSATPEVSVDGVSWFPLVHLTCGVGIGAMVSEKSTSARYYRITPSTQPSSPASLDVTARFSG